MYCGQTNIYRPFWIWTWAVGVLCPSTWPPHSRTSPGKSTWVTLMDVKHNWMDPQKTPFHYCWVFSERYPGSGPKGSHGKISRCELSGRAMCRQRQGLQEEAKDGVLMWTYVWILISLVFFKKKVDHLSFQLNIQCSPHKTRHSALLREMMGLHQKAWEEIQWEVPTLRGTAGMKLIQNEGPRTEDQDRSWTIGKIV